MERHVDLTLLSVTTEVSDWLMYRVCHFKKYYCSVIDPFNKSNIYSFPLLTSLKLQIFNRISKAGNVVNSGKLLVYIRLIKRVYNEPRYNEDPVITNNV